MTENGFDRASERRPRKALLTKAVLLKDGVQFATVRVRNLSHQGLGGESSAPLAAGDALAVELRGVGTVPATVAWSEGGRFGLRFDTEINLDELRMASPAEVKLAQNYSTPRSFDPTRDTRRPGFTHRRSK